VHQEDLEKIHKIPCVLGCSFLFLHPWYIGFNPLRDTARNKMISLKLPGLPIELFTIRGLADIGNSIGRFIYVDPKCLGAREKIVTWILVELGFFGGLLAYIDLAWEQTHTHQRLDYWSIPFLCLIFHHTGHLMARCPQRISRKEAKGGRAPRRGGAGWEVDDQRARGNGGVGQNLQKHWSTLLGNSPIIDLSSLDLHMIGHQTSSSTVTLRSST